MLTDLRYALRLLWKSPGFSLIAIATLALGIGANTAIFSVVNAVLLRPLPFPRPEKLLSLWELNPQKGQEHQQVSAADFADWEKQTRTLASVAAYSNWNYNLTGGEEARRLNTVLVSAKFFQTLGAQPEVGRTLLPADDVEGKDNVVVLSHAFWQSRFGGSRAVVGQTALLNGKPHTIVGVMPAGFDFPDESVEIWRPLAGIFAAVALLLAAIGTYGVLSCAVAQRRSEIGIRMALGAQTRQIGAQFLSLGLRLLAAGSALGLLGAWLAGRAMQSVLFDVPALPIAALLGTALVMTAVSLIACLLPARRATQVNPMEALRNE
ncbi:MAG: ABC transporter permease [Chthoniobacterales bacterium]